MLATEVNQTYFAWSQGESTERDGSQGVSVSQTLDHGSISFGRFELESLSWEKWSVFTNDRRHEEFGKFNGLVAEKKAYFEEYYKRIRDLKASQQQNQQTELSLEYSGDGSDSSQREEDKPSAELETPTGSGTGVDDYVEQAAHETTSEQGLPCHDDHEDENFNAEFSSSNLSSSAGVLQQTDQDIRKNVCGDNSDSANRMDIVQQNVSSGHDGLGAAYEAVRAPKRIIEKDSRLIYASKIIPKTVKTLSDSPLDRISVSKRPVSVKASMSMNQKTKPNNTRSFQRPNAAPQKMAGTTGRNKLTAKETLGLTSVRRPSSASARRPSTAERHHITRESVKKPTTYVSTPRRPSTAERSPVTRERAQKQAVATPRRPSTSERRPVNRESAAKHADITAIRRPSTGERRPITRDSVLKMDPGTLSNSRATVAHPKGATTTASMLKMAATPNASKSSEVETKRLLLNIYSFLGVGRVGFACKTLIAFSPCFDNSNIKGPKGPSTFDSHTTRSKRMDLQVAGKQKSSSVNLPPRKKFSSSVGEPALETFARPKKKEGIQTTMQSRASASKKTTPSQTGKVKARAPNPPPPPPPPPPRRPSRTMNKPNASNSSMGGRKPKASAPKWH